jgi:hypothetical protein
MTSPLTASASDHAELGGQLAGQAVTRHRQRTGGRFQFAAQISDGQFHGGRDAARAVEDRHGDRRFAALEFVARCRDLRQLITDSVWRSTSGEVMVCRVNAGNPAAMTRLTTPGGEKASSALPEAAACAGRTPWRSASACMPL